MISVGGIVLASSPLSNFEITDSDKKLRIPSFRWVFVRDALPRTPNRNECGILNLDDSSGNGTYLGSVVQKEQHKFLLRELRRPVSARIAAIPKERHTLHHRTNSA